MCSEIKNIGNVTITAVHDVTGAFTYHSLYHIMFIPQSGF